MSRDICPCECHERGGCCNFNGGCGDMTTPPHALGVADRDEKIRKALSDELGAEFAADGDGCFSISLGDLKGGAR